MKLQHNNSHTEPHDTTNCCVVVLCENCCVVVSQHNNFVVLLLTTHNATNVMLPEAEANSQRKLNLYCDTERKHR